VSAPVRASAVSR